MKIIIAGTRTFTNYQKLKQACDYLLQNQNNIEIVSGACRGTDKLGERYAKERGYKLTQFLADWKRYGRAAGPKRNEKMANYADALIAFWDGGSKGTLNMIDLAKNNDLRVRISYY